MSRLNALLFSILVTLSMNALDVSYHMLTNTAVHVNYVAVKFAIIFVTVYLITAFIGTSMRDGIAASILGPLTFYLYYRMASPTLNRSLFILDENVGYVFLHSIFFLFVYWVAYKHVLGKKSELSRSVVCSSCSFILAVAGLVYTFIPYSTLKQVGMNLELGPSWTPLLGILCLLFVVLHLAHHWRHERVNYDRWNSLGVAFLVAVTMVVSDVLFQMITKSMGLVDYGTVIFDNVQYVFAHFLIALLIFYLVFQLISRDVPHGLAASLFVAVAFVSYNILSGMAPKSLFDLAPHYLITAVSFLLVHHLWKVKS